MHKPSALDHRDASPALGRGDSPSVLDRRGFIKQTALGAGIGAAWPALGCSAPRQRTLRTDQPQTILFQGDSITDAGRSKNDQRANVPHSLGSGYAAIAAARLLGDNPGSEWTCFNRGISGDKVHQLAERWQEDCLDLNPDVLSILIGVNDFWHTLSGNYEGTAEIYERDYRTLLDQTLEALPAVRLIIGEPFAIRGGTAIDDRWRAFDAYRAAAHRIAQDYRAEWIPYHALFDEALETAPAVHWAPDGVHPSPAGNHLMAEAWLDALAATQARSR